MNKLLNNTELFTNHLVTNGSGMDVLDGFVGNWDLLFAVKRYLRTMQTHVTPMKFANASLALLEMAAGRTIVRSLPFILRLEPTSCCNLRCPRCSTGLDIDHRPKGFISLDDLDYVIEQVKKMIVLTRLDGAGEPFLHPQILECIHRIRRSGIGVDLSSHFNHLPSGDVEGIVESGLDRLIVAVDGATQEIYERYRVGGKLTTVLDNIQNLVDARIRLKRNNPFIEIQFLDWGYNSHHIHKIMAIAEKLRVNRLTVINPDKQTNIVNLPRRPKRCFWLWCVLTMDWRLNHHSCTNAWTYEFPGTNARHLSMEAFWNSEELISARQFNRTKKSTIIEKHQDSLCNHCTDMLVTKRPPGYVCE